MKFKKSILALGSIAAIAAPIAAVVSCGGDDANKASGIVLALDGSTHSQNDKSFNEGAYKGILSYTGKSSAPVVKPAADGKADFLQMYSTVEKGSTIVAPGFAHIDPLTAATDEIAGKKVILLDGEVKKDNIASIDFKVEQAAFLDGYLFAKNATDIDGNSKVEVSGFVGATYPTVTGFIAGFRGGIEAWNKANAGKIVTWRQLGSATEMNSNSFAPGAGKAVAQKVLDQGIDYILPVAGPQTKDALDIIKNDSSLKTQVIGVDSDQKALYEATYPGKIAFSITKNLQVGTEKMLAKLAGKADADKSFKGLGETTIGTPANGLVGVADGSLKLQADFDKIIKSTAADDVDLVNAAKAVKRDNWFY